MTYRTQLSSLRMSLLAALGLSVVHCGGNVVVDHNQATGGGGSGPGSTGATQPTTGPGGGLTCEGSTPITAPDGTLTGFERCADGTIHRVSQATCTPHLGTPACTGMESTFYCASDADCKDGPNGKCAHFEGGFDNPGPYCGCAYSCVSDADCLSGVCICSGVLDMGGSWAQCANSAACVTDQDCSSGECGVTSFFDGCWYNPELACRTTNDVCRVDAQCEDGQQCVTLYGSGQWSCEWQNCAIGRPLLVNGQALTAPPRSSHDWAIASFNPDVQLDTELRQALADHWQTIAALEHASIASFARFTLQLLSLGAPPDLIQDTQQAAADEVQHAKIAYTLASAYADHPLGPANLDVAALPLTSDRRHVIQSLIEEACVGETLGVAEALAIANAVQDSTLRSVLLRVARDEQRHAELAWRTLRWLLHDTDKGFAAKVFEETMAKMAQSNPPQPRVVSRQHGLLSAAEIRAIRTQALDEVVRSCANALLDLQSKASSLQPPA